MFNLMQVDLDSVQKAFVLKNSFNVSLNFLD